MFKGKFSTGRLTNTSKSVYSFEGEVLSEEDDEYNSDSSYEDNCIKENKAQAMEIHEVEEIVSAPNKDMYPFDVSPEAAIELDYFQSDQQKKILDLKDLRCCDQLS